MIDAGLVVHKEATDFLRCLDGASLSPHTVRVYAGRVAAFLGWCDFEGVAWRTIGLPDLARFKHFLEMSPIEQGRYRSGSTVNAILTAVCEFLRFCARTGLVQSVVAEQLSERRWLKFTPPGFDAGESGQFRLVRARLAEGEVRDAVPRALTPEQSKAVSSPAAVPVSVSWSSAARHRFTASARRSGCAGRTCTCCRTLAASGVPSSVPMSTCGAGLTPTDHSPNPAFPGWCRQATTCSRAYGDYQVERSAIVGADGCDMVLVNLYHQPLGQPTSYRAVKDFFDRLARSCGFPVRPHMMRHTAATNWVRAGVDVDVVRALLGQVSLASTTVYLHARDEDCAGRSETVAAGRTWR